MQNGGNNAGGGKAINWATVVLVIVTGGGNWLQTKAGNDFNAEEIQRATREIHDLYPKLDEAVKRQREIQTMLQEIKFKIGKQP